MGIRDDLYQDIDKLYAKKLARISSLREKSLDAIRDGRLPEGLDDKIKDVIRWVLEDREMRLRRKRDLKVLHAEWQVDKDERESELNALLDEFAKEREVTRANWREVQAKVIRGKAMVDGRGIGIPEVRSQEQPLEQSLGEDESEEKSWQIGEE